MCTSLRIWGRTLFSGWDPKAPGQVSSGVGGKPQWAVQVQKERESHESRGGDRKRRDEEWRTGVWRRGEWGKNWNLDCLEPGFSAFSLSLLN